MAKEGSKRIIKTFIATELKKGRHWMGDTAMQGLALEISQSMPEYADWAYNYAMGYMLAKKAEVEKNKREMQDLRLKKKYD